MSDEHAEISALRLRIAEACRVLGALDLTPSTFGHISARLPGSDRIFIRARGPSESGVRYTTEADIIEVDLEGQRVGDAADGYSAPLEVFIHTEIYRRRSEVNSVLHSHPASTVLLTICDKPLLPIYGAYDPWSLRLVLAGIPTYDRSILIQRPELGEELAACMGSSEVCLMRGHGITTAANSVEEATLLAIHLETISTMTCRANAMGNVRSIPPQEQDAFRDLDTQAGYGAPLLGIPSGRAANLWRYYTRLVGGGA
jgi:ribulose-5-phosphate 4-epimerase/fuculose-1-phosphate aldolase